jgi:hypothetical protein
MGHHYHHPQVPHLGVELQEAQGLGPQAVLEAGVALHLQLQLHYRAPRRSGQAPLRPEHAIEAVIHGFEFHRFKAVELVAGGIGAQAGGRSTGSTRRLQQQRDQVGRALEQAGKPVVGGHRRSGCLGSGLPPFGQTKIISPWPDARHH